MIKLKCCAHCKAFKARKAFSADARTLDGKRRTCRTCSADTRADSAKRRDDFRAGFELGFMRAKELPLGPGNH
jgi:hypothetical protein